MTKRVYLDWNATAPLRPAARAAMLEAMDVIGNPSSVHTEGRAAKAIVEKARGQVAALVGCEAENLFFTSGATEGAEHAHFLLTTMFFADVEHDCIRNQVIDLGVNAWVGFQGRKYLAVRPNGVVEILETPKVENDSIGWLTIQAANSETGVLQPHAPARLGLVDAVQAVGRTAWRFDADRMELALLSGHKLGGPKGVGATLHAHRDIDSMIDGGGQERGRRAGTENVVGIAGFGAAAEAARRELDDGYWDRVEKLRDNLEDRLASAAPDIHVFGTEAQRLPNTSCFAVPGWKGETQVMQMDLAGYAISAGSACSSGKVSKASRVLLAMGFDEVTASSAIRVSMGPTTTEVEVMGFADTWIEHYRRRRKRAA